MLDEVKKVLAGIRKDTEKVVRRLTENHLRCERYDVTTAPDGTVIGVTQPFGAEEILIPYSWMCSNAQIGDTVIVVWWNGLSNAQAWFMGGGWVDRLLSILPGGTGISINGDTSISGDLSVGGAFSVNDLSLSGNLAVDGQSSLGDLDVNGTFTADDLSLSGNLDVSGTLDVGGDITADQDLSVGGDVDVTGSLTVGGNSPKLITASGANNGWTWVKYTDGSAEMWGRLQTGTGAWSAWGSWYVTATECAIGNYPFAFTDVPSVVFSLEGVGATMGFYCSAQGTATVPPKFKGIRPAAGASTNGMVGSWHAMGRWQ